MLQLNLDDFVPRQSLGKGASNKVETSAADTINFLQHLQLSIPSVI